MQPAAGSYYTYYTLHTTYYILHTTYYTLTVKHRGRIIGTNAGRQYCPSLPSSRVLIASTSTVGTDPDSGTGTDPGTGTGTGTGTDTALFQRVQIPDGSGSGSRIDSSFLAVPGPVLELSQ